MHWIMVAIAVCSLKTKLLYWTVSSKCLKLCFNGEWKQSKCWKLDTLSRAWNKDISLPYMFLLTGNFRGSDRVLKSEFFPYILRWIVDRRSRCHCDLHFSPNFTNLVLKYLIRITEYFLGCQSLRFTKYIHLLLRSLSSANKNNGFLSPVM